MPVAPIPVARAPKGRDLCLFPAMANRHGLVAGATGTGKTVTLRVLAEQSRIAEEPWRAPGPSTSCASTA